MKYIFGYGSLITPIGINGRNMQKQYNENDLFQANLFCARREWNAVYNGKKYLGLVFRPDLIHNSVNDSNFVNGVIFQISDADLIPFKDSEGIGEQFDPPMYHLVDVTAFIVSSLKLNADDQVFTCVTVNPTSNGEIPPHYIQILNRGFDLWGPEFKQTFIATTCPKEL